MKTASFVLGLIAGIVGIISAGVTFVVGMGLPVTNPDANFIVRGSIFVLVFQIAGLVLAAIRKRSIPFGIIEILAGLSGLIGLTVAVFADVLAMFLTFIIAAILFVIAGIFKMMPEDRGNKQEKQVKA